MEAGWHILAENGRSFSGRSSVRVPLPNADYEAIAVAHSTAVQTISKDIAAELREIDTAEHAAPRNAAEARTE